jgi:hydroxyacylglutathione hydrolase
VPALTADQVEAALAAGAVVHDARDVQEFASAHLRGSINVPADGRMAETVGMVFSPEQQVVVIAPEGVEQEVATRFSRIGFDHVVGYVADPEAYFLAHEDDVTRASRLSVAEADARLRPRRRAGRRHPQRRRARVRWGGRGDPHPAGRTGPPLR